MVEQGLAAQLCNSLYSQEERVARQAPTLRTSSAVDDPPTHVAAAAAAAALPPLPEPSVEGELSVIISMRDKWTAQLHTMLLSHCEETGQPLMRVTADQGSKPARAGRGTKWLYTSEDVLALLEQARHPNQAGGRTGARSWCLTPVSLRTPQLPQLRQLFAELAPTERQNGLDDEMRGWFADERCAVGSRLLQTSYAPLLRQFARQGVPAGLRARLWMGGLQLGTLSERDYNYFGALQQEITRVTLATDEMVRRDAAAPSREEDYFVFGEMIEETLLVFCRDPAIGQRSGLPKPRPVLARNRAGERAAFPPSGVPPFKGLADFVAPLCFVYAQPAELYFCFREMWMRYWCKLHAFSSAPGSLLPLVKLFEEMLQETAPAVCLHLLRLEMYPGKVALQWISSGFASLLPAEQTLILWDRVIGFDSLELLPILAAAIFVYRAKWLLQASEPAHVQRLLQDATGLRVVPLLQLFLSDHNQLVLLDGVGS
jgi:hypothetical protein